MGPHWGFRFRTSNGLSTCLLVISNFLLVTSVFTVAQAVPLAPTGSLTSKADAYFILGPSILNGRSAIGTTSASVSLSLGPSALFAGSYQATATTDFGRNDAMSTSLLQDGSGVSARAFSQWTDGFVIVGGSGAGTASLSVLLEGTLQVSAGELVFLENQPAVETASFFFSLDQTIAGPGDPRTGESTSTTKNLIRRSHERSLVTHPTPFDPPRLVLSELVTASFTFEYDQPFFLTGHLTTGADVASGANVALIGGASADFLSAARVIQITLPKGATLFAGSGSYAVSMEEVPFANLAARVKIDAEEREFEATGTFTLGAGSNGIDPMIEDVSLDVGAFAVVIPAGSFRRDGQRAFKFEGVVGSARLEVKIDARDGKRFAFKAEGKDAPVGKTNPVTLRFVIGNDAGSTLVTARLHD